MMESLLPNLAVLLVVFISFYLAFIRPERKAQKKRREMLDTLRIGDKVVTLGGLYGTIIRLSRDVALIEIASGVEVTIVRSAVKHVVGAEEGKTGKKKLKR